MEQKIRRSVFGGLVALVENGFDPHPFGPHQSGLWQLVLK
jgi:hypothetical protein